MNSELLDLPPSALFLQSRIDVRTSVTEQAIHELLPLWKVFDDMNFRELSLLGRIYGQGR
jgi:hypothetical protein